MKEIPVEIGNLELLQELGKWEIGIGFLTNLTYLDVSHCRLMKWPLYIEECQQLIYLDLSFNQIEEDLPSILGIMLELKTLVLNNNQISALCFDIYYLQHLEYLNLCHNKIIEFPPSTNPESLCMKSLTHLDASFNQITTIDDTIGIFKYLQLLNLSYNNINKITDKGIINLSRLINLDMSYNQLKNIITEIGSCIMLTTLNVSNNKLQLFPDGLMKCTRLNHINLSYNQLSEINGKVLSMLNELQRFELQHNDIIIIPILLYSCKKLEYFDISYNQIHEIHENISQLINLTYINLSFNQINNIPETISELKKVITMELKSNQLTSLPNSIIKLKQLKRITISKNNLLLSPNLIEKLPLLLSCNLSWNRKLQGNYIDWVERSRQYDHDGSKHMLISIDILYRKVISSKSDIDHMINSYDVKPVKVLYKLINYNENDEGNDDVSNFLVEMENDDDNDKDQKVSLSSSLQSSSSLSSMPLIKQKRMEQEAIKKKKKMSRKAKTSVELLSSMLQWHEALQSYFIDSSTNKMNINTADRNNIDDVDGRNRLRHINSSSNSVVNEEPTIDRIKRKQKHRLTSNLLALLNNLDQHKGDSYGSIWKYDVIMKHMTIDKPQSSQEMIDVLLTLDIGIHYQDQINKIQYLINEIDTLLIIQEFKYYYTNYQQHLRYHQNKINEDNILKSLAPALQRRLSLIKSNSRKSILLKQLSTKDINNNKLTSMKSSSSSSFINTGVSRKSSFSGDDDNDDNDDFGQAEMAFSSSSSSFKLQRRSSFSTKSPMLQNTLSDEMMIKQKLIEKIDQIKKPMLGIIFTNIPQLSYELSMLNKYVDNNNNNSSSSSSSSKGGSSGSSDDEGEYNQKLLANLLECLLNYSKILLLRCYCLRDGIREVEQRCDSSKHHDTNTTANASTSSTTTTSSAITATSTASIAIISTITLAERNNHDIVDGVMDDIYDKLAKEVQSKLATIEMNSKKKVVGKNKKRNKFDLNALDLGDGKERGSEQSVDGGDDDRKDGGDVDDDGKDGVGSNSIDTDDKDTSHENNSNMKSKKDEDNYDNNNDLKDLHKLIPPINNDSKQILLQPIEYTVAIQCISYLSTARVTTLCYISQIIEIIMTILHSYGYDHNCPTFQSHQRHSYNVKFMDSIQTMGGRVYYLHAKLYQQLQIYSKSIESYKIIQKLNRNKILYSVSIEMIKIYISQGNYKLAHHSIGELLKRNYKKKFMKFYNYDEDCYKKYPESLDILSIDRNIGLLYALNEEQLKILENSYQMFSSKYNIMYNIQDNGLISSSKVIPIETQYGYSSGVAGGAITMIEKKKEQNRMKNIQNQELAQVRNDVKISIAAMKMKVQSWLEEKA